MFKRIVPVLMLVFVAACANGQGNGAAHLNQGERPCPCKEAGNCPCREHALCPCCAKEDGACDICHKHDEASSVAKAEPCPVCLERDGHDAH